MSLARFTAECRMCGATCERFAPSSLIDAYKSVHSCRDCEPLKTFVRYVVLVPCFVIQKPFVTKVG